MVKTLQDHRKALVTSKVSRRASLSAQQQKTAHHVKLLSARNKKLRLPFA